MRPQALAPAAVAQALMPMGVVIALRWLATLYRSAIQGLQDQVWLNVVTAGFATLRGWGVIPVLAWLSPSIQAFFIYQAAVTALEVLALATRMRCLLPAAPEPLRFRWQALRDIWRFAAGMVDYGSRRAAHPDGQGIAFPSAAAGRIWSLRAGQYLGRGLYVMVAPSTMRSIPA
ncbi:MAG: hypothetical protein IPN63_13415 [Gammaproteobacteria bacterium]|nr:hypothetical protein [Gammaproteobacteria bacterium]